MRRYGIDSTVLIANQIEALVAIGDWDEADRRQRRRAPRHHLELPVHAAHHPRRCRDRPRRVRAPRERTSRRPRHPARGPRARHLRRLPRRARPLGAPLDRRRRGHRRRLCQARARARLRRSASGSAPRGCAHKPSWPHSHAPAAMPTPSATGSLARGSCSPTPATPPPRPRRSRRTPPAGSPWPRPSTNVPVAALGPSSWSEAASTWDGSSARPSRPTAAGARPRRSSPPAPPGPRRACRSGRRTPSRLGSERKPLLRELELLAQRARLDLAPPAAQHRPSASRACEEILGLTPREAEVLTLVARGYTNREIAATLVISVKTASVHVSHILRKLDAPNRREAAAIAHRLAVPGDATTAAGRPASDTGPEPAAAASQGPRDQRRRASGVGESPRPTRAAGRSRSARVRRPAC